VATFNIPTTGNVALPSTRLEASSVDVALFNTEIASIVNKIGFLAMTTKRRLKPAATTRLNFHCEYE